MKPGDGDDDDEDEKKVEEDEAERVAAAPDEKRSHSMHVNLSVEDLVAVSTSTSLGVTPVNGRTNGTTIMPRSASGVTILDIMNPRSYSMEKAMKRDSRFQSENCIHMIPLVILLCYFCLWIASSGWSGLQSRWPIVHSV
ncbi:hypothetical protein MPTK1_5g05190 [Marchantia polymorpha subsp. ruderalis]|uniref:Uncharacterized protein n=2 Tax=Marchantia polymorpha TaxID=3197 RepID=A0AAF6BF47_MARPO|nr:hypothetical protein MARPO_0027s0107 [Marchantia polymorpha]PTQ43000.1 hypothetical protein MARPO_0027s0107 [Marchantia polymorpha]BBN10631.1 hypothetical protein Mp_5g05190 [Marchantia polymorpha subsp. ruderalis]BBN10632.1 hypothetical protein Mp_5g05190 [Marchantia polymorpha subsp. ruderalis]|eukprot:PTQ42999.1 hypothetical protein MARPO_0027s0107 [Marchantia polymorpha]